MNTNTFLALLLSLALAACSTPKKPEPAPEPPKPQAAKPETGSAASLPADSWRAKIIEVAKEEWIYFGQQKVVIEGDEESIPHVGFWEDDDFGHSDRINQYWRAVGKSRLTGNDCKEPWSAAFVSWVMQTAGVPESLFPPAIAHKSYLTRFLARADGPNAVLIPHTIQEYKPKPGDLICANRGRHAPTEVIEEIPDTLNPKLHCDIVVDTKGQTLHAIGGNVRNSVSKTILALSPEGYLQFTHRRPWFLIIENRLD